MVSKLSGIKQAAAEEAARVRLAAKEIKRKIEMAEKIPEEGESYLELVKIEKEIEKLRSETRERIETRRSPDATIGISQGFLEVCLMATFVGAICLTPAIGLAGISLLTAGAGFLAGAGGLAYAAQSRSHEKAYVSPIDESLESALAPLSSRLNAQKENLLRNDLSEIGKSPYFEHLRRRFPAVKNAFAEAAAKAQKDAPPRPSVAPADEKIAYPYNPPPLL